MGAFNIPPPPVGEVMGSPAWQKWFYQLGQAFVQAGSIDWDVITNTPTTLAGYGITSPLDIAEGGTGLSTLGAANQVLAVNAGATALEYQTISSGGDQNVDGGTPSSIYTPSQVIDGGTP